MKIKYYKKIMSLFVICIFLVSCDPPHFIDFVNKTNGNAKVKLNLNPEINNSDLGRIAIGDSIILTLKKKDTANIDFGIGTWSDKQIKEVVKSIKSIEIETDDIKTIYKTENSIKNILQNNTEGFIFKSRIEIEIK